MIEMKMKMAAVSESYVLKWICPILLYTWSIVVQRTYTAMPENAWPQRMIEKPTENEIIFEPINQMGKKWDFDLMEMKLSNKKDILKPTKELHKLGHKDN